MNECGQSLDTRLRGYDKQLRRRDSNPRDAFAPNGFQDRRPDSLSTNSVGTYESPELNDTKNDTKDPDLALVFEAWPELSEAVRAGIVALIRASCEP